jgi:proteasome assembly chaperone 2
MSNRTDAQMMFVTIKSFSQFHRYLYSSPSTPTYHIRPPSSPSWECSPLSSISQLPIPEYSSPVSQFPGAPHDEGPIPFIPGGGLTRRILSSLPESWEIPIVALLQFVLEGDNRSDASLMAAVVAKALTLDVQEWKQPFTWQQGLFGIPHDQTLYG